jgi:hypothetical protein
MGHGERPDSYRSPGRWLSLSRSARENPTDPVRGIRNDSVLAIDRLSGLLFLYGFVRHANYLHSAAWTRSNVQGEP